MFVVPVTRTIGKLLTDAGAYSQRYTSTPSADVAEDRDRDTAVSEDSGGAAEAAARRRLPPSHRAAPVPGGGREPRDVSRPSLHPSVATRRVPAHGTRPTERVSLSSRPRSGLGPTSPSSSPPLGKEGGPRAPSWEALLRPRVSSCRDRHVCAHVLNAPSSPLLTQEAGPAARRALPTRETAGGPAEGGRGRHVLWDEVRATPHGEWVPRRRM